MQTASNPPRLRYSRYQKNKPFFQKRQIVTTQKKQNQQLMSLLEQQIGQQDSLLLPTSCSCSICRLPKKQAPGFDLYGTRVEAYGNFFQLLIHLTIIPSELQNKFLKDIHIPMLFFVKKSINKTKAQKIHSQFILFESNKIGGLQSPKQVKNMTIIMKLIKNKEQLKRKLKMSDQANQGLIQKTDILVHHRLFDQKIPPYILLKKQTKDNTKKGQIMSYIIHSQDRLIVQNYEHKIKKTQPFCIMRYLSKCSNKYQILTIEGLLQHQKDAVFVTQEILEQLSLKYIQSFVRIKRDATNKSKFHTTFYSNYDSELLYSCAVYKLSQLQIKLKTQSVSNIDPCYMSAYHLDKVLMLNLQQINEKFQNISNYRTYKFVHVLKITGIKVQKLSLKWILNEEDDLVLMQCLQYQSSPLKNAHSQRLLQADVFNCLQILEGHKNIGIQDLKQLKRPPFELNSFIEDKVKQYRKQRVIKDKNWTIEAENEELWVKKETKWLSNIKFRSQSLQMKNNVNSRTDWINSFQSLNSKAKFNQNISQNKQLHSKNHPKFPKTYFLRPFKTQPDQ